MTIASILLHAPARQAAPSRGPALWALELAAAFGARLKARVFDADATTGGPAEPKRALRYEGQCASRAALDKADWLLGAAADLGLEAKAVTDRSFAYGLPEVAADHARLHDLVVAGAECGGLHSERPMAEHLIFEANRPVVVVPASHSAPFRCDRVVVAWGNSRSVMGAFGHSRLRQFVLGGATRSVLGAPCLPVLLSH